MIINDSLHVLFRRVQPEEVINSWITSQRNGTIVRSMSMFPAKSKDSFETTFINSLQNEFRHYTVDEAWYAFNYAKEYQLGDMGGGLDLGVFGLIAKSVEGILITDSANECLCKPKELLQFRSLTHTIDPTIFVAAFLAKHDIEHCFNRQRFSWNPIVRASNSDLYHILNNGMAENHFHIGGSSNAFLFSWICLMNHFDPSRKNEFNKENINDDPLDTFYTGFNVSQESDYLLTFKAVCIRYYLYLRLRNQWVISPEELDDGASAHTLEEANISWLIKMLSLTEDDCDVEMAEIDSQLNTMRCFCLPVDSTGFIPDYALRDEPVHPFDDNDRQYYSSIATRNYERRLFRPLAGEQRFLYNLFKAIYTQDKRIFPYYDIIYAYLLIYCRLRGELIQANNRIGFGNFLKYQNRKDVFTCNYHFYDIMRTGIAERVVLENPQVISLEGRISPANSASALIQKVRNLIDHGTKSICGVSDYYCDKTDNGNKICDQPNNNYENEKNLIIYGRQSLGRTWQCYDINGNRESHHASENKFKAIDLMTHDTKKRFPNVDYCCKNSDSMHAYEKEDYLRSKLQFVIHFPKRAQEIRDDESIELVSCRDNVIRNKTLIQANAIIEARSVNPEVMSFVVGVDACSSEIDCRPEVFAPSIRKICLHREETGIKVSQPLPVMRITYHAGEDFLDPLDGLRAIEEAISFCGMRQGDRLGHALALGINCADWYAQKKYTVIMRSQSLLDNLVWLYGKMSHYNIYNKQAEDEIFRQFHRLFASIYQKNQDSCNVLLNSVDINQYYTSLLLRGNDPNLYLYNPESEGSMFEQIWCNVEPWQLLCGWETPADRVSSLLYHYYHFNFKMKKASNTVECYKVPKSIVEAVCELQNKMQYDIANKGIYVESNPSSNFLIGTFKDYLRHPIFTFNNKNLFSPSDKRYNDPNPLISVSINTDDLGIFDTSLENEYALLASALENYNDVCEYNSRIPRENIYSWLNNIREIGCKQSFKAIDQKY